MSEGTVSKHFHGTPCRKCGGTLRYRSKCRQCVACMRGHSMRWRAANPAKALALDLARSARSLQDSRTRRGLPAPTRPLPPACECCGKVEKRRALCLDHCHATNKFRGWLCTTCNSGIGKLGDTVAGLQKAVQYLQENG